MDSNNSSSAKPDVYQIVTDRIIALLENGTVPWQKPWTDAGVPANLLSKRSYRGINLWLLLSLNYERNLFLTWDQIKKVGASVKKGEVGHVVIYWKALTKNAEGAESDTEKKPPILRYYKVFNIAQCRDLPEDLMEPQVPKKIDPILECEAIIAGMPKCPEVRYKQSEAFYHIAEDYINMPKKKSFKSMYGYYSILFHELVHSSGHESRLNRKTVTEMAEFGSEAYSLEELIAELGSAYLSSFSGILDAGINNSTAYIKGWLAKLKGDKRFMVQAAGQAQKAVDYIMNKQTADTTAEETELSEVVAEI